MSLVCEEVGACWQVLRIMLLLMLLAYFCRLLILQSFVKLAETELICIERVGAGHILSCPLSRLDLHFPLLDNNLLEDVGRQLVEVLLAEVLQGDGRCLGLLQISVKLFFSRQLLRFAGKMLRYFF